MKSNAEIHGQMRPTCAWLPSLVAAMALITLTLAPLASRADDRGDRDHDIRIRTLSSLPNLVSGGSALVQIEVPHERKHHLAVHLNGQDITGVFHADADRDTFTGLVTGLNLGENTLRVRAGHDHDASAELRLTNYSIKGPIVSGPQIQPFICQTQTFKLPDGTFLGPPLDADCSAPTVVTYVYMSTVTGAFKALPSTTTLPSDVATTTTSAGLTVPYVVRVETGTMNRGIYQNAILFDPTSDPAPSPF